MKPGYSLILGTLLSGALTAQSSLPNTVAAGGGFTIAAGFTNSYTIGQGSIPETYTAGSFILTQGFQQPIDMITGIAPLNENDHIGTFPNPSNGQFFIEYDLDNNSDVTIEAFDVVGQMIYSETSVQSEGHQTHPINLIAQPNGVYFIRCSITSGGTTTVRTTKITLSR